MFNLSKDGNQRATTSNMYVRPDQLLMSKGGNPHLTTSYLHVLGLVYFAQVALQ